MKAYDKWNQEIIDSDNFENEDEFYENINRRKEGGNEVVIWDDCIPPKKRETAYLFVAISIIAIGLMSFIHLVLTLIF